MSIDSIEAELLALVRNHKGDHDGGYKLATELCEYRNQANDAVATDWDEVLLEWVQTEKTRLWGIALEALARVGGRDVDKSLSTMLRDPQCSTECKEYIVHTLLRRGVANGTISTEVEREVTLMTSMAFPNLALLFALRPDLMKWIAEQIDKSMSSGRYDDIQANMPPFVYAVADSDINLLILLVEEVHSRHQSNGKRLAAMLLAYIQKPFVKKRLGVDRTIDLIEALSKFSINYGNSRRINR